MRLNGRESYYEIAPKDYETLREIFLPYDEKNAEAVYTDEVPLYTPYVGDASKTSKIARSLPYPDGYTYNSIKIWSQTEPYGLDSRGTFR